MDSPKGPVCPKCSEDAGHTVRMVLLYLNPKYENKNNPPGHHADICYCERCKRFWSFWYSLTKIEEKTPPYYTYPNENLLNFIYKWCARLIFYIIQPKIVVCLGSGVSIKFAAPFGESNPIPSTFKDCVQSVTLTFEDHLDDYTLYTKLFKPHDIKFKGRPRKLSNNSIPFISAVHPYTTTKKFSAEKSVSNKIVWKLMLEKICSQAPAPKMNTMEDLGKFMISNQQKKDERIKNKRALVKNYDDDDDNTTTKKKKKVMQKLSDFQKEEGIAKFLNINDDNSRIKNKER